ncbi:hypothetical protein Tco_1273092 [Tanacetum coccineum]
MDPNSSLGKISLGENIVEISSDKIEESGDWNSPEFQDTANKACNGEINLGVEENMISNEYALIINPEDDDVKPGVILGRSFLHDVPLLGEEELLPFVCKMGKKETTKEALAIRMSQKFALLEEERPIIETMAYHDKYKKILNEVWKDKVELDGKIIKEEEEAVQRIKGEVLKEKHDPGAFIFPIRLEGQVNENALADTGLDINTMPYRIYEQLGREEIKKVDKGITMINHT